MDGGAAAELDGVFVGLPAVHLPEPRLSAAGGVGGRGRGWARTERGIKARRQGVEIPQVVDAGDRFVVERRDGMGAFAKRRVGDALPVCPEDVEEETDCG